MVKLFKEESAGGWIHLKFRDLISICEFRPDEDLTDFEVSYKPSQIKIDAKQLETYLASAKMKIAMEMIPLEILKYCIRYCLLKGRSMGIRLRDAAPEEVEINSASGSATPGKGKEWGMKISLKFKREPA